VIPFEFIVNGPPISAQAHNRRHYQGWIQQIRRTAEIYWPNGEPPSPQQHLKITVTYYFEDTSPDVDNIIKPFQDALVGLVYANDNQISDTRCKKRDINGEFKIKGLSPVLAEGFVRGNEFLHVKIEIDTNQGVFE